MHKIIPLLCLCVGIGCAAARKPPNEPITIDTGRTTEEQIAYNQEAFTKHANYLLKVKEMEERVKTVPPPLKDLALRTLFDMRQVPNYTSQFFPVSDDLNVDAGLLERRQGGPQLMQESQTQPWLNNQWGAYLVVSSDQVNFTFPEESTLHPYENAASLRLKTDVGGLFQLTVVDRDAEYQGSIGPNPDRQRLSDRHGGLFLRVVPYTVFGNDIRLTAQTGADLKGNGVVSFIVEIRFEPPE